jgi:predicted MFS family arabinose efflux permease
MLAVIGFVLVTMETMPAGLLPIIATGMNPTEATVGHFVSAYALGIVIVTVPAITLTRAIPRKLLLLAAVAGLILANSLTAIWGDVTLSLVSRFVAGAFSGIIWGMLAAYGRNISPPRRAGLALAIVSAGAPVGFALGTPLGPAPSAARQRGPVHCGRGRPPRGAYLDLRDHRRHRPMGP